MKRAASCFRSFLLGLAIITNIFAGAPFEADAANWALSFDGTGTGATITNDPVIPFDALPLTVTFWMQTTQTTAAVSGLVTKSTAPASLIGWQVFLTNGQLRASYCVSPVRNVGGSDGLAGPVIADGLWHYVAFVVDTNSARLYVDAGLPATSLWTGLPGSTLLTNDIHLGAFATLGSSRPFIGAMDEITIWGVALTPIQIASNTNGFTGNEPGLNAYYRCDEGIGPTLFDSAPVAGANDGTLDPSVAYIPSTIGSNSLAATVVTLSAATPHPGQAILSGQVNRNLNFDSYWFEHGLTTNYGNTTITQALAGSSLVNVSNLVTGLPRGVSYHFRAVAHNGSGVTPGNDLVFSTHTNNLRASGIAGGGQPIDLRQPALELNFIICTNGIFPSQSSSPAQQPMLSEIRMLAGSVIPAGWMLCQGQLLSITNDDNTTALFNLIGTTYGGDGITNFALPDFRGRAPIEEGNGWIIGEFAGANEQTLVSNQLPAHVHSLPAPDNLTGSAGAGYPCYNQKPVLCINFVVSIQGNYPIGTQTVYERFLGEFSLFACSVNLAIKPQGASEPIAQNQALYSVLGTNFGGNGSTTFLLPDLRSRTPMGIGTGTGPDTFILGQNSGSAFAYLSTNQMPSHRHTALGGYTGFTGSNQPVSLLQPALTLRCLISTNGQPPSPAATITNTIMGEIVFYAGTNVPIGSAECNGQILSISSAPTLFGVISNRFGGDGISTFALPDMSGRIPVCASNSVPGASYGAQQIVLTESQLPPHTHIVPAFDYDRWITSFGIKDAAADFSADFDADGLKNGFEWAISSNPTNASATSTLTISNAGPSVAIRFPRNTDATDVIFTLQRATDLGPSAIWSGIATNQTGVWTPPGNVTEFGSTNPVQATVSDTRTNIPSAFYRLKLDWP